MLSGERSVHQGANLLVSTRLPRLILSVPGLDLLELRLEIGDDLLSCTARGADSGYAQGTPLVRVTERRGRPPGYQRRPPGRNPVTTW